LKYIEPGKIPRPGRYAYRKTEGSIEKINCKYNPTSDVLVVEREGGEIREVSCEFISRVNGFCSQTNSECFYYENLPKKREEKKKDYDRLGREWIRYMEDKLGKGEECNKKWYAMTPEARLNFKKQFIKEMESKGWTSKDVCLFREMLNFWG